MIRERRNSSSLFATGRTEVYSPDLLKSLCQNLLRFFDEEFTHIVRGLEGSRLSNFGEKIYDRINSIYTDTPYSFEENAELLSNNTDKIREAAFETLEEEAILVVVLPIYHSV